MATDDVSAEYSINAVSRATGLTVATLRAWERRYGIVEPKRNSSGHRVYTAFDVSRLRRLRETTERGHPIGKIAHLSDQNLGELLSDRASDHPNNAAAAAFVARIMASIESYQLDECDHTVAMAFALLPAIDVVREVLGPAMRQVGDRWHRGEFTIGQERLVSNVVRRQVNSVLNTYNSVAKGASAVFATLSGEQHELGILMYGALAASRKMRVHYLGSDVPPEEIADFARHVGATAVAISMVMPDHTNLATRQLALLRRGLPRGCEIWIGGAASCEVNPLEFPEGSVHMARRTDFDYRVDLLGAPSR